MRRVIRLSAWPARCCAARSGTPCSASVGLEILELAVATHLLSHAQPAGNILNKVQRARAAMNHVTKSATDH